MRLRPGAPRGRPPRAGAPGTITYGLNVQAWCVFLMVMHLVMADLVLLISFPAPEDERSGEAAREG